MPSHLESQTTLEVLGQIGSFMEDTRRSRGLSLEMAAHLAVLDRETVRRIEKPKLGERTYSIMSLLKYLRALGRESDLLDNFRFSTEAILLELKSPDPSRLNLVRNKIMDNKWVRGFFEDSGDERLLVLGEFPGADAVNRFLDALKFLSDIIKKTETLDVLQGRKGVDLTDLLTTRHLVGAAIYRCDLEYQDTAANALLSLPETLEVMDVKGHKDLIVLFGGKSRKLITRAAEKFADARIEKVGIWWKSI